MDAIELLTTTKGVRRRIDFDRPVPYETLQECVAIARIHTKTNIKT